MDVYTTYPGFLDEKRGLLNRSSLRPWFHDTFSDLEYVSIHMLGPFGQILFPKGRIVSEKKITQINCTGSREERIILSIVLVENIKFL